MISRPPERAALLGAPEELTSRLGPTTTISDIPVAYHLWWHALSGEPIDTEVEETFAVLRARIERIIGTEEVTRWSDEATKPGLDHDDLSERIAQHAEAVSTGYRSARQERTIAAFTALAWYVRALSGIATARARREGAREARARDLAAMVGAGHAAFLGDHLGIRFELQSAHSPVNSELAYAFSAIAEAHHALSV